MTDAKGRYIHSHLSSRQIPDLLQSIFIGELICPSRTIWLVSPWISDIPVIENTANQFLSLEPTFAGRKIRLSEIVIKLLAMGTTVCVVTRPDNHNQYFLRSLNSWLKGNQGNLILHEVEELHEKGLLGDFYYLAGSMNFTYNGITLNQESVHFHNDSQIVAENRIAFAYRWGGGVIC